MKRADVSQAPPAKAKARRNSDFEQILLLLYNHAGVNFSLYKPNTILRRITRRVVLNDLKTLQAYAHFLDGNVKELALLYADVLINVTGFFRNPEVFETLKHEVFPALMEKQRDEPLRIWVAGCSTGQEAYSIIIAYLELSDSVARVPSLQVFATDLNEAPLVKARAGFFLKGIEQQVSPERLQRFFVEEEGGYRIQKRLRDMVIFARQNIASDPSFSRLHLISCRNLMIYLEPSLQKKIMPTLHYALNPGGFLLLGASETIGTHTDLFVPVDKKCKIYRRGNSVTRAPRPASIVDNKSSKRLNRAGAGAGAASQEELVIQREADRVVVRRYAPPGVLINAALEILQFRGATQPYLKPPTSKASFNVLNMAQEGLMLPLRATINKAKRENKRVRRESVSIQSGQGQLDLVNIEVIPLKNLSERCYLILFEPNHRKGRAGRFATAAAAEGQAPARKASASETRKELRRIAQLEEELTETRDYLQTLQEQHDAANEELQATNEEVQSANEELQSSNEELETSKEELESTNEELITVNEEVGDRNTELGRLNSDLKNVQLSINMPILVLGRDLTIRRYTPLAEKIFNLRALDIGRAFSSVKHNLHFPDLEHFIADVIDATGMREREVQDKDGCWYALRARPYVSLDNKIDGAILVLIDIDALKRNEQRRARDHGVMRRSELRYRRLFEAALDGVIMLDPICRTITDTNPFMAKLLGFSQLELVGKELWQIGILKDEPSSVAFFRQLYKTGEARITDLELKTNHGRNHFVEIIANLYDEEGTQVVQCNVRETTERKRALEVLNESEERFGVIADNAPIMIWMSGVDKERTYFNKGWLQFTGRNQQQRETSHHWGDDIHPEDRQHCLEAYAQAFDVRKRFEMEYRLRRYDGEYCLILDVGIPRFAGEDCFLGYIGSGIDITERKQMEQEFLKASKLESIGVLAGGIAHDFNNLLTAIIGNLYLAKLPLDPTDHTFKALAEAENACFRARDLTQ